MLLFFACVVTSRHWRAGAGTRDGFAGKRLLGGRRETPNHRRLALEHEQRHATLRFAKFRVRARQFPALINCTSIDWFQKWPEEALVAVGERFVKDIEGVEEHDRLTALTVRTEDEEEELAALEETIEDELERALKKLGFYHLSAGQIDAIMKRADEDDNCTARCPDRSVGTFIIHSTESRAPVGANRSVSAGVIDYEEFVKEAPKTLKTNLVKLAKNNGAELGFLS